MKMILCSVCHDLITLAGHERRSCACGASWGRYRDDGLHADIGGESIPMGISNRGIHEGLLARQMGCHLVVKAFFIGEPCATIHRDREGSAT